ncbi:hypothetical protein H4217_007500 [Coemansia sp. RSA 1939]|nr:hypothetical protein H4217_007500 [Coemansia sp. RSA 1939]KAJ2598745.1 hypothetical protein EV177_007464 [Coemansia sp. RSA 1804]
MKYTYPSAGDYQDAGQQPSPGNSAGGLEPAPTRGRSESDGFRTVSARSSADDRAPLAAFFGTPTWQRMSTVLPQGVRDPLNIDELEREERLMPFTEMAVGGMDFDFSTADLDPPPRMPAAGSAHDSVVSGTSSQAHHLEERTAAWGVKAASMRGGRAAAGIGGNNSTPLLVNYSGSGAPELSDKSGGCAGSADAHGINWAYMQDHNLRTGGLPSLDQVLTRRTRAPLALRDFAVHCSVRQPQARRWLEFYMAARTHEKMCLAYESDLRHAKARSHYASLDSHLLPPDASLHHSNRQSSRLAAPDDGEKRPLYADDADDDATVRRAAARSETMKSLSGRSRRGHSVFVPEEPSAAGAGSGGDAFRRSRRQSSHMAMQIQTAAETIFLRYFRAALDPNLLQQTTSAAGLAGGGSGAHVYGSASEAAAAASARARGLAGPRKGKMGSLKRMLTQKTGAYANRNAHRPDFDDPYHQGYGVAATDSVYISPSAASGSLGSRAAAAAAAHGRLGSTESLTMSREYLNTPIGASAGGNRANLGAGAAARGVIGAASARHHNHHHLYYHMPWPPEILTEIEQRLLNDGAALDASLFSEALLYAYDVLDTYYFPIFIADAVSRNVTRDHCILRVMFAFVLLWLGFALPLALILLDHEPKAQRAWSVIPQFVGWWNMAVGFGGCDLLLAAMRKYQSPTMKDFVVGQSSASKSAAPAAGPTKKVVSVGDWRRAWFSTRISVDPTATRMVRARSIRWFIGAIAMTAISSAILCAVPGTHIYTN